MVDSGISFRGVQIPVWEIILELIIVVIIIVLIVESVNGSKQDPECECANQTDLRWLLFSIGVILAFILGMFWGRHLPKMMAK